MADRTELKTLGTQELIGALLKLIRSGSIAPGTRLPPLDRLEEWSDLLRANPVNRSALHRALVKVREHGLIKSQGKGPGGGFIAVGEFEGVCFAQGLHRFWIARSGQESELGQVENWYPAGEWSSSSSRSPYPGMSFNDVPEPMRVPAFPDYLKMASARLARHIKENRGTALKWTQIVQDLSHPAPFVRRVMMRRDGHYAEGGNGPDDLRESIRNASIEVSATRNALRTLREWSRSTNSLVEIRVLETSAWLGTPFIVSRQRCLYGHYFVQISSHLVQGEYRCDPSLSEPDTLREMFWQEFETLRDAPYSHDISDTPDDPTDLGILFMSEYKDRYELRKT